MVQYNKNSMRRDFSAVCSEDRSSFLRQTTTFEEVAEPQLPPQPSSPKWRRVLRGKVKFILLFLFLLYFSYSIVRCLFHDCKYDNERWTLILLTCTISSAVIFYYLVIKLSWPSIRETILQSSSCCLPWSRKAIANVRWSIFICLFCGYVLFVLLDCLLFHNDPRALISLAGVFCLLFLCGLASLPLRSQEPVPIQPIIIGFALHFATGVTVTRLRMIQQFFTWLSQVNSQLFKFAGQGSKYLFGTIIENSTLRILSTIPFFAALSSAIFHLTWGQNLIKGVSIVMEKCLATTVGESFVSFANIFIGLAHSPLFIVRYLPYMTKSELHAVLTAGFATLAIHTMATEDETGIDSKHILVASLMSAPGALALTKLAYPETEVSSMRVRDIKLYAPPRNISSPKSLCEAAFEGISMSVSIISNVIVNVIAIISGKAVVNEILTWLGDRAGVDSFTVEFVATFVFWSFAYLIGVPFDECMLVAKLFSLKIFANNPAEPFAAMDDLISNRLAFEDYNCGFVNSKNATAGPILLNNGNYFLPSLNVTIGPFLSKKTEVIATYGLSGFSNIVAVGIQLGCIGSLSPKSKSTLATLAIRALLVATAVNLLNAATIGLLYHEETSLKSAACTHLPLNQF